MERGLEWVVGLDLGTTNSCLARIPLAAPGAAGSDPLPGRLEDVEILQRISEREVASRRTLPSFLYLPGPHELPEGATSLPWAQARPWLVGEFARNQGSRVPGRVVSSAKSWLAHRQIDPTGPILPWEAARDLEKISPVEASRRYLEHLQESWDHGAPASPLALQELVITVPASFDEVARELTLLAADQAGLTRLTLLEEPQAAFYAWLWRHRGRWREALRGIDRILVCDLGGGTSDFSLIGVDRSAGPEEADALLTRIAVGDHLMLGGDNLDLALAHTVEGRLGGSLDLLQWGVLRHECRRIKELLLGEAPPEQATITVPGSGARLLGAARTAEITREEVERQVLDGFFPHVDLATPEAPEAGSRAGLSEWGLPYASDPAVPRHLARFLQRHGGAVPGAVLFNGGACRPPAIRQRLVEILERWRGGPVQVLENPDADLSVARGAAAFAWLKAHGGERIRAGSARSYYLGVDLGVDEGVAPSQALCLLHHQQQEGEVADIPGLELTLLIDRPVAFPLYSASARQLDRPGDLVAVEGGDLQPLGELQTVIQGKGLLGREIPVHLSARLTEIGTLAVWASPHDGARRWALELPLRGRRRGWAEADRPEEDRIDPARALITACFARRPGQEIARVPRPRLLLGTLEETLGPRDSWRPSLLRALWEGFYEQAPRRRADPEFEAAWLNGAGFCLRPGIGYPLDAWRAEEMARLLEEWLQHPKEERVRREWWVFWRRVSAGLRPERQGALWAQLAPHLLPGRRHLKTRLKAVLPSERTELWRLAVSLEKIDPGAREELGRLLAASFRGRAEEAWQLSRVGARRPLCGGLEHVLPAEVVAPWVERLLERPWRETRSVGQALTELARRTGARGLDLPEPLREAVASRLRREGLEGSALAVEEVVEIEEADRARLSGDSLPIGLRLRA